MCGLYVDYVFKILVYYVQDFIYIREFYGCQKSTFCLLTVMMKFWNYKIDTKKLIIKNENYKF